MGVFRRISWIKLFCAFLVGLLFLTVIRDKDETNFNYLIKYSNEGLHDILAQKLVSLRGASRANGYVQKLQDLIDGKLISSHEVVSPTPDCLNIGMLIINMNEDGDFDLGFKTRTMYSLLSLILLADSNKPLHLIFVTDEKSKLRVGWMVKEIISKILTVEILAIAPGEKTHIPKLYFSMVDYHDVSKYGTEFQGIFKYYLDLLTSHGGTNTKKYFMDFFNIAPMYHRAFTKLEKLLFVDCSDLEYREDINLIRKEMDGMDEWPDVVMGIARDLSPHYWDWVVSYRREVNNKTQFGKPGRYQGFNSGVVLYDLEKMRNSKVYNEAVTREYAYDLFEDLGALPTVGDQDFYTALGFVHPELFYIIDCQFNAQTSLQYMQERFRDTFDSYHYCDQIDNIKIIHKNGCGPSPSVCGEDESKVATKFYLHAAYNVIELEIDWLFFTREKYREVPKKNFMNYYNYIGGKQRFDGYLGNIK